MPLSATPSATARRSPRHSSRPRRCSRTRSRSIPIARRSPITGARPGSSRRSRPECWLIAAAWATELDLLSPRAWSPRRLRPRCRQPTHIRNVLAHEVVHVLHGQLGQHANLASLGTRSGSPKDSRSTSRACSTWTTPAPCRPGSTRVSLRARWPRCGTTRANYPLSGSIVRYIDRRFGRAALRSLLDARSTATILAQARHRRSRAAHGVAQRSGDRRSEPRAGRPVIPAPSPDPQAQCRILLAMRCSVKKTTFIPALVALLLAFPLASIGPRPGHQRHDCRDRDGLERRGPARRHRDGPQRRHRFHPHRAVERGRRLPPRVPADRQLHRGGHALRVQDVHPQRHRPERQRHRPGGCRPVGRRSRRNGDRRSGGARGQHVHLRHLADHRRRRDREPAARRSQRLHAAGPDAGRAVQQQRRRVGLVRHQFADPRLSRAAHA